MRRAGHYMWQGIGTHSVTCLSCAASVAGLTPLKGDAVHCCHDMSGTFGRFRKDTADAAHAASVSEDIRCLPFGYSACLDMRKQSLQSILQVAPLGFASRWKHGGESAGRGLSIASDISAPKTVRNL